MRGSIIEQAELERLRRVEETAKHLLAMWDDPVVVAKHLVELTIRLTLASSDPSSVA